MTFFPQGTYSLTKEDKRNKIKYNFNSKQNINGISELKIHVFLHSINVFRSLTHKAPNMSYFQRPWVQSMSKTVSILKGFKFLTGQG